MWTDAMVTDDWSEVVRQAIGIARPLSDWLRRAPQLWPRFHDRPRRRHSQTP